MTTPYIQLPEVHNPQDSACYAEDEGNTAQHAGYDVQLGLHRVYIASCMILKGQ
jgi:hypothetical protein